MFKCTIPAVSSQLDFLIDSFEKYCGQHGLEGAPTTQLQMILEETVSNIINHGYPDDLSKGRIRVCTKVLANKVLLTIIDDAIAFNPTEFSKPDTESSVEDRQIGGLGLYLISQLATSVCYRRLGKHNVLTISKKLW